MSKEKDGGAAFPFVCKKYIEGRANGYFETITEKGMSLRDYFAAKVMQGILAHEFNSDYENETYINEWYSERSYEIADAMLEARKK